MFYLTKRVSENQCTIGERVMVLADFSGVPAGTIGKIVEIYHEGVMVQWIGGPNVDLKSWQRPLEDGFSRDELEYLAFATSKHPRVDPETFMVHQS